MLEPDFLANTRDGYNAIATVYAERFHDELDTQPLGRAMLAAFAELVQGPVLEAGSGPGRVTAHLHALGLDIRGIDLSPEMVTIARRNHPNLRYDEGSMTALDIEDGTLGGLLAWYSFIHIPPPHRADVLTGFHRALTPGGHLLLAFQVGDESQRRTDGYGRTIALDWHRIQPANLTELLVAAGFTVEAELIREPYDFEKTQQAYLLARRAT